MFTALNTLLLLEVAAVDMEGRGLAVAARVDLYKGQP
jgi:hypothetical protein